MRLSELSSCALIAVSWCLIILADNFVIAEMAPGERSDVVFVEDRSLIAVLVGVIN